MTSWVFEPGDRIKRSELHDLYGGGRQGGMEPSSKTPNVFLFTNQSIGVQYGYNFDGWHSDGTFHYTGEGQVGDQKMVHGNRAARDHHVEGRALRLFQKAGTDVIYIGEFELPDESHILLDEAPDRFGQPRTVFVFRLKPVGAVVQTPDLIAPSGVPSMAQVVPLEASNVETFIQQHPDSIPIEAQRTEAKLVARYARWLGKQGQTAVRHAVATAGGRLMYTDMFVPETGELIEAKSSSSRHHMRVGLGQALDYARYIEHAYVSVLTPTRPAHEMVSLLVGHGVGAIWEETTGAFEAVRPAAFPA